MAKRPGVTARARELRRLETALGHRFKRRALLEQALRHRSALQSSAASAFERLEFLGDAALSHAVAALLFARWPEADEGTLTRARAALVRESSLAALAERLGLAAVLELGSGLRTAQAGPALLADAVEALLGALLLDGGWRALRAAVRRHFQPLAEALDPSLLSREEPKSTLQELAQSRGLPLPLYRQVEVRGPAHLQTFVFEVEFGGEVLARGEGSSKKAAQQDAARLALEALDSG
ncbi:MAG TPA: ribonuclease III [Thermoanaerobaculaceae bacterium]|nr:ribonuclease III [Thermoanaerobaculaceae bacterium]